jgi:hypothetical protein
MEDSNAFLKVLKNRIIELIPMGLSDIWLKLTGDGEFDAGRVLGFDSHEWKEMTRFSGLVNGKGIKCANWEGCFSRYGLLIEFEKFQGVQTDNVKDQSKWVSFSLLSDEVCFMTKLSETLKICEVENFTKSY